MHGDPSNNEHSSTLVRVALFVFVAAACVFSRAVVYSLAEKYWWTP